MIKRSTWDIKEQADRKAPGTVFRIKHEYRGLGWAGVNQNGLVRMFFDIKDGSKARAEKYAQTTYKSTYLTRLPSYGARGVTGSMVQ